jgi:SAM-dependent methyltransferase
MSYEMSFDWEAEFFSGLLRERGATPKRVLIVGCGDGTEANHIARASGTSVTGIDLEVEEQSDQPGVQLLLADASRLPFRDGAFDALYCYHVLEHVQDPPGVIGEAHRVLARDSVAFFGTPNRARLLGYMGARATLAHKIRFNLNDWGHRLRGRWSNAQGAHAGFTSKELAGLLAGSFPVVHEQALGYYEAKYPKHQRACQLLFRSGFARLVAPSVYFVASEEPHKQGR